MELSLKDLKESLGVSTQSSGGNPYASFFHKNVFVRTVTMAYTGKLVAVHNQELVLEDAAWIADTGRFADFLKDGKVSEVEPYPAGLIVIGRGAIVDVCEWGHELPRKQI